MYSSSDSFLPSGAAEPPRFIPSTIDHPSNKDTIHRSIPDCIPDFGHSYSSRLDRHKDSFSPPLSMVDSTDDSADISGRLRRYIHKLLESHAAEKAHLHADRQRAQEMAFEEQDINLDEIRLLKQENAALHMQIRELKIRLGEPVADEAEEFDLTTGIEGLSPPFPRNDISNVIDVGALFASTRSAPDSSTHANVACQTDPVWLPRTGPPARTFDPAAAKIGLNAVGNLEEGLRCPIKDFRPEDFQITTPEQDKAKSRQSGSGSVVSEGIHGSVIDPKLDGVVLKDSAVAPSFRFHSPSPRGTPLSVPSRPGSYEANIAKQHDAQTITEETSTTPAFEDLAVSSAGSPPVVTTASGALPVREPLQTRRGCNKATQSEESTFPSVLRETTNTSSPRPDSRRRESSKDLLLKAPPGERRIANAGHTPIHSRSPSKHEDDPADDGPQQSGNDTTTQVRDELYTKENARSGLPQLDGIVAEEEAVSDSPEDRAMQGPLTMGHGANVDPDFIAGLDEALTILAREVNRRDSTTEDFTLASGYIGDNEKDSSPNEQGSTPDLTSKAEQPKAIKSPEIEELEDEVKPLKIKEGSNFGMPWGRAPGAPPGPGASQI